MSRRRRPRATPNRLLATSRRAAWKSCAAPIAGKAAAAAGAEQGQLVRHRDCESTAASCHSASRTEQGLQVRTILAARAISAAFPEIHEIGGVRPDPLPWHPLGLAIDVMIPDPSTAEGIALGDQIVAYVLKNANRFGIQDAIWRGVYYTPGGAQSAGSATTTTSTSRRPEADTPRVGKRISAEARTSRHASTGR